MNFIIIIRTMKDSRLQHFLNEIFKIITNYTWSFVIIISITVISSILSINYLNLLENEFDQIFQYDIAGRSTVRDAYSIVLLIDNSFKDLLIDRERESRVWTINVISSNIINISNLIEKSGWRFMKKDEWKIYNKARKDLNDYIYDINLKISDMKDNNDEIDKEFLLRLKGEESRLLSDFSTLVLIKRNSIISVFKSIKLQLGTSLVLTSLLLALTVTIRVLMYLNVRNKKTM